jgi:hypothetical protein
MKTSRIVALAVCMAFSGGLLAAQAPGQNFSPDQLDNLLAPVALYPDPLLAQVLTAATFVDQVEAASHMLRSGDPRWIDSQPWDVSVKSVAHYPSVVRMMSNKPDWTIAVGQAYIDQPNDVMASIQRLRMMAHNQGNLVSNQQQEVIDSGGYISIDPIQAQYIYVPVYNPSYIYYRRGNFLSFGAGFAIGAWLNYDFNWGNHGIFYHGWGDGERGWIGRSRGYVGVTNNVYINNSYHNVQVNRGVAQRTVNYGSLNNYNSVHNTVNYNNVAASRGRPAGAIPAAAAARPAPAVQQQMARQQRVPPAAANALNTSNQKPSALDPRTTNQRNADNRQVQQQARRAEQQAQRPPQQQQAQRPPQQAQAPRPQQQQQAQRPPQQHEAQRPQQAQAPRPQQQQQAQRPAPQQQAQRPQQQAQRPAPQQQQAPKQPPPQHAQAKPPQHPEKPEKP